MRHQVVVYHSECSRAERVLDTLRTKMTELGLDSENDLDIVGLRDAESKVEFKGIPVCLWFGHPEQVDDEDLQILTKLLDRGVAFLPLVSDLENFQEEIPTPLHSINGISENDELTILNTLMSLLHWIPSERRVFISYCRKESSAVAKQLFESLSFKGFNVFLDTVSVQGGEHFQRRLLDRLNDFDLLILLDTPGISKSIWVREELVTVQNLGMGVFQVVWPDRKFEQTLALNQRHELEHDNFIDKNVSCQLHLSVIEALVSEILSFRLRSLGARRQSIIGEFLKKIESYNRFNPNNLINVHIIPGHELWIQKRNENVWVWPSTRQPTSFMIHEKAEANRIATLPQVFGSSLLASGKNDFILYDGLGIHPDMLAHLAWLRKHLPLLTRSIDSIDDWLLNL